MLKKIAAVTAAVLLLASCSSSPEELKDEYFNQMQQYGVDKSKAINAAEYLCKLALKGEAKSADFMEEVAREDARVAEVVNVIVKYGIPAYCPKFADDFTLTGTEA